MFFLSHVQLIRIGTMPSYAVIIKRQCEEFKSYFSAMADNHNTQATQALLESNAKWAANVSETDPDFFPDSAKNNQTPHVRPFFFVFSITYTFFRLFG
jgi:hypothetical protein